MEAINLKKHIEVKSSTKTYKVIFKNDLVKALKEENVPTTKKVLIVTDKNIAPIYLKDVENKLNKVFNSVSHIVIPAGGKSKSLKTATLIYQKLLKKSFTKHDYLVALGGGVTGDIVGFVAATFYRGMNFIQIPTSLLSQVDSSIGGKVAIHFQGITNAIGTIYPPDMCIISSNYLRTLSTREISCGFSEIIKMAYINDKCFFNYLHKLKIKSLSDLTLDEIAKITVQAVKIKKNIVEMDEYEKDQRLGLNFGHTLSHALETQLKHTKLLHGEGVAHGMLFEVLLSNLLRNNTNQQNLIDLTHTLKKFELLNNQTIEMVTALLKNNKQDLLETMSKDKKNTDSSVSFILPMRNGFDLIKLDKNDPFLYKALSKFYEIEMSLK